MDNSGFPLAGDISLSSGYVVRVTPLPPYYMDVIKHVYPHKQYPKREYKNVAGDVFKLPYEPPEEKPPVTEVQESDLWHEWKSVQAHNDEMDKKRLQAREDFLLSMCVSVVEGPIAFDDDEWVEAVEGAFHGSGYKVPDHAGARMLLFLKAVVISNPSDKMLLMEAAMFQEVSEQGIEIALQGFRRDLERQAVARGLVG